MSKHLALLVLAGGLACGSDGPATTPDAAAAIDASAYTECERGLEGRSFKGPFLECGQCECGATVSCDWTVRFEDHQMSWSYSDVIVSDSYTCTNGTIVVGDGSVVTASYDGVIDFVTLDGQRYDPCPGVCTIDQQSCEDVCPTTGP